MSNALSLLLTTVVVSKSSDSSHLLRPHSLLHMMSAEEKKTDDDQLVSIRIRRKTQRRLALQGYVGQTFDMALQTALDKLESCHCRPLTHRRVTI
jgi:hypothetical protein